ncbi:hypothetical protein [Halonotius sp. GCM10025705]|uniref:hypothetical protein n=1 Tax=Halonotius sp. GCM10025705 TaxID=3252678 RepID=UPI00361AAB8C
MDRRRLLMAGGTAMSVGLAGCSGLLGGGNEEEGPTQPEITRIGVENNAGEGVVTGTISNPTGDDVSLDLYVRIYTGESPETLRNQSPEEELDRPDINIPAEQDGPFLITISGTITVSRLSDNIEAALLPAGETPAEGDYRWYGPDADTLNADA